MNLTVFARSANIINAIRPAKTTLSESIRVILEGVSGIGIVEQLSLNDIAAGVLEPEELISRLQQRLTKEGKSWT